MKRIFYDYDFDTSTFTLLSPRTTDMPSQLERVSLFLIVLVFSDSLLIRWRHHNIYFKEKFNQQNHLGLMWSRVVVDRIEGDIDAYCFSTSVLLVRRLSPWWPCCTSLPGLDRYGWWSSTRSIYLKQNKIRTGDYLSHNRSCSLRLQIVFSWKYFGTNRLRINLQIIRNKHGNISDDDDDDDRWTPLYI